MNTAKHPLLRRLFPIVAAAGCVLASTAYATDGYFLQGFGAVNAALGGAATAGNDQDLIGSIYKNPSTAILFPDREFSIIFGDVLPSAQIDSSVVLPGLGQISGSSKSTVSNVPYLSLMGIWKQPNDPNTAWFFGVVSEAGLNFHIATSATNPIFFPQPGSAYNPFGGQFGGFGDVRSSLYVIRIPIGAAVQQGPLSWGFELAPSIGRNLFTPAAFAAPGIGADMAPIYPTVQQDDVKFGLGAQGGLRYEVDKSLSVGASISTPTWFETYTWTVHDPSGDTRTVSVRFNRPLTAEAGLNYAIAPTTHLLADVGYIAYGSTPGFENSGYRADGSLAGLGWTDAWTFEVGLQHAFTKDVVGRIGYNYCSDPISDSMTFYNVGSPLHLEQHLSVGLSVNVTANATLDVSYTHGFSHSQSGPWYNPLGAVPGTSVTSTISGDEFAIGTTFRF